jgi:hypothetical protein
MMLKNPINVYENGRPGGANYNRFLTTDDLGNTINCRAGEALTFFGKGATSIAWNFKVFPAALNGSESCACRRNSD